MVTVTSDVKAYLIANCYHLISHSEPVYVMTQGAYENVGTTNDPIWE